jgi:hypothetical protein
MTSPDLGRAWALFMSDPTDFVAMFATVIVAVAVLTWWLRHFIGKERIATLEERCGEGSVARARDQAASRRSQ